MKAASDRAKIIDSVQTPLAFFVLVVLMVESFLGLYYANSEPKDVVLLYIMSGILVILVLLVAIIAYLRPESLYGRSRINSNPQKSDAKPVQYGSGEVGCLFSEMIPYFKNSIPKVSSITTYFIHSRRWRENCIDEINEFLSGRNNVLEVYLPNLKNKALINFIQQNFDDGASIPAFIADAERFFSDLEKNYPGKVRVKKFDTFPTYSFYKLDDEIIFAMYPTSRKRKDVPAFITRRGERYWDFIIDDLSAINRENKSGS